MLNMKRKYLLVFLSKSSEFFYHFSNKNNIHPVRKVCCFNSISQQLLCCGYSICQVQGHLLKNTKDNRRIQLIFFSFLKSNIQFLISLKKNQEKGINKNLFWASKKQVANTLNFWLLTEQETLWVEWKDSCVYKNLKSKLGYKCQCL